MESFTHESEDSSSCTQSDDDSTNSSNGTNPFLLCPRGNPPHLRGHGRLHDRVEDIRPYKRARREPSGQLHYHPAALNNSKGLSTMPYAHNVKGEIHPDDIHRSLLLSEGRSRTSSALENLRGLPSEFASAARSPHAGLPYIGTAQNFLAHDQWPGLRQQTSVGKPFVTGNAPSSALLLPMNCKLDKMPISFGNNAGNFYLGLADPQPGRCRRTDGKKWRCGRAVVPEQKYCERHMHRGRGRSKAAKLAKGTTTIDTNESHDSGRPPNQPLIQLLSHLTVPVQHVNQPLEIGQQPADAVQPLKWIQKAAQTFQPPNTQVPYLAQPLLAEPLSQFPSLSRPLDWSANQSPMQAEPLDLGQANGRPPVLAQAIPMNAVSDFKMSPDRGTVLATTEASRMPSDDLNDVLSIDVQGIKRLLENAPCSRRPSSVSSKPKQLPNLADLLNVAHVGNLNRQPKKPPSLMDVLKLVDSPTDSIVRAGISSVFNHRHLNITQASADLCTTICQTSRDLLYSGYSGTSLSLAWPDEQSPEQQSKQCLSNMPGTMNLVTSQMHNGKMNTHTLGECPQPLAQGSCKGPSPNCTEACTSRLGKQTGQTSETTNIRQPELLLEESKDSCETLERNRWNLTEERSQSTRKSNKDIITMEDVDYMPADQGFDNPRSLMVLENRPSSKYVTPNHHNASLKSDSESLVILEGSLDVCDSSGKSKGCLLGLTERNVNQHIGEVSPNINGPVSMKKRMNLCKSYANLDMNIPILVAKDECQQGDGELGRDSPSSTTPIENVQRKTALDRSSSNSSCNESSLSKSTLSLDPAAEPSSHSSLANQWEAKEGHEKACCLACYHLSLDEAAISSSLL